MACPKSVRALVAHRGIKFQEAGVGLFQGLWTQLEMPVLVELKTIEGWIMDILK